MPLVLVLVPMEGLKLVEGPMADWEVMLWRGAKREVESKDGMEKRKD